VRPTPVAQPLAIGILMPVDFRRFSSGLAAIVSRFQVA